MTTPFSFSFCKKFRIFRLALGIIGLAACDQGGCELTDPIEEFDDVGDPGDALGDRAGADRSNPGNGTGNDGGASAGSGGGAPKTTVNGCVDFTIVGSILADNCTHCHSLPDPPQALNLEAHAGVMAGGETGKTIVPCKPDQSLLYQKISMSNPPVGVRMPKDGPPYLSDDDIATIRLWIEQGAQETCTPDAQLCNGGSSGPSTGGGGPVIGNDCLVDEDCEPGERCKEDNDGNYCELH